MTVPTHRTDPMERGTPLSGMPNFHWSGDSAVKRQSTSTVIADLVYHVDQLQARAQALRATAVSLCQQVTSQVDTLRRARTDYRDVAAASAALVLLRNALTNSDHDLDLYQEWVNSNTPGAIGGPPGTLPYGIAEALNGYGGGLLLGRAVVYFGTLASKGIIKAIGSTTAADLDGIAVSLADTGITAGEVTAAEAGTEVTAALAEGTLETVSAASLAAFGAGAIITIGIDVGAGLITGKQTADHLNKAIAELNTKIATLTRYSTALHQATTTTRTAIGREQQRVRDIITDLGPAFGPAKVTPPEPGPANAGSTVTAVRAALDQYKIYVNVRTYWKNFVGNTGKEVPPQQLLDYFAMMCAPFVQPATSDQIKTTVRIMARYSHAISDIIPIT